MTADDRAPDDPNPGDAGEGVAKSIDRLFDERGEAAAEEETSGDAVAPGALVERAGPADAHRRSRTEPPDADEPLFDEAGYPIIEEISLDGFDMADFTLVEPDEAMKDSDEAFLGDVEMLHSGAAVGSFEPQEAVKHMAAAVDEYVTDPERRSILSKRIRGLAWALREARLLEPIAMSVERLASLVEDDGVASLYLARQLVSPSVSRLLAGRLAKAARNERQRSARMSSVVRLGELMALALVEALIETEDRASRKTVMDTLKLMGDDARAAIEGLMHDERWFVVRNAAIILREIGGQRSIGHFTAVLAHEDHRVRKEALLGLARVGGASAGMAALGMVGDADAEVRWAAAFAVGRLRPERSLKVLLDRLDDEEDADVRKQILLALGSLRDPAAVSTLEKHAEGSFFRKPSTSVRVAAYRALWSIGTPRAREVVQSAFGDRDDEVREAVLELTRDS